MSSTGGAIVRAAYLAELYEKVGARL